MKEDYSCPCLRNLQIAFGDYRWALWRDIFKTDGETVSILDRSPESFFRSGDNGNLEKNRSNNEANTGKAQSVRLQHGEHYRATRRVGYDSQKNGINMLDSSRKRFDAKIERLSASAETVL
ncbi:hypothetical protein VZT92_003562 [Zoarces viviparus]|uniref:Uncharacterized protein n=1 Tax=Zoarces viviparus TaxID=48416 RepID=A0AAW1FV31_ZOAVI